MIQEFLLFFAAGVLAIFLPRLPLAIIPRLSMMEGGLAPFPEAQPVNEKLLSQLLMLRSIWRTSFIFALIPIGLGFLLMKSQPGGIALGLFLGGGWSILSRLVPNEGFTIPNTPYPRDLLYELNEFRVGEVTCCSAPEIVWQTTTVACRNCDKTHLHRSRPDLGRRRTDGLIGYLRLLLLDGHPLIPTSEESVVEADTPIPVIAD